MNCTDWNIPICFDIKAYRVTVGRVRVNRIQEKPNTKIETKMATTTKSDEIFEYTSGGLSIKGTASEILKLLSAAGVKVDASQFKDGHIPGYYVSASKGLLKIEEMSDYHIRNALLKHSREYFQKLVNLPGTDNKDFLRKFMGLADQPVIVDLFNVLNSR